jgi:LmbE family N-acetylglucosaminyl deacetylase
MQMAASKRIRRSLLTRLRHTPGLRLDRSAVIFAPHQDDETLGCGGTIIHKTEAGARITIVFLTDGSTSHRRSMPAAELTRIRKQEALAAAELLGVPSTDIHFLDFPDGRLSHCHRAAVTEVSALLGRTRPEQVFVPYRADGTPDHEATYRIVTEALHDFVLEPTLFEYPVWLWNQWPWVPLNLRPNRESLGALWRLFRSGIGLRTLEEFETAVFVGDVLPAKRRALDQHRSQMTQLLPAVEWATLSDVSGGAFLDCFFQDFEIFRRTEAAARRNSDRLKRRHHRIRNGETLRV